MNLEIWKKAWRDAFWLLAGCVTVLFAFMWLFVYMTSFVPASAFVDFVAELPDRTHGMFGIGIKEAASWPGRLSLSFVDPTVVVIAAIWAIARGSDTVSGPLDRGTMEMLLAQPVSRMGVLFSHATVTVLGAGLLAIAAWSGLRCGIATVNVEQTKMFFFKETVPLSTLIDSSHYVYAAVNLFSFTVFTAAVATVVSACGRYRWRTIGIAGGFLIVQIIIKMLGLAARELNWVFRFTYLGAYWPQVIAVEAMKPLPNRVWELSWQYNGILLGAAIACYIAAAVIFHRRDLPAPL